jgi:hypothetical protein
VVRRALLIAALAGCGSFEDPAIVIDLRMVAMTGQPPEQVLPLDDPDQLVEHLVDVEVCARVADPASRRRLSWRMTACAPRDDLRCPEDDGRPWYQIGAGSIEDPETASTSQLACATLRGDAELLLLLEDAIADDPLAGFGGVDLAVAIEVWPEGDREEAIFGAKRVRYAAQLPAERVANTNPFVERIDILVEDADPMPLRLGRCVDQPRLLRISAGADLPLEPVEPPGVREEYLVPTFEGDARMFTETLTYQWLATAGSWTRGSTGGPRDASGTFPPLDTRWLAPDPEDVTEEMDVTLWMIQRDERLGVAWYESCVRVVPAP